MARIRSAIRSWCRRHFAAGPVPAEVVNPFLSTAFIDRLEVI